MKNNKGFTLVELIIVIAILAIIMLIAIPNFSGIQQRMQVRADKATAAQIGKAVRVWFTDCSTDSGLITGHGTTDAEVDANGKVTAAGMYAPEDLPERVEDGAAIDGDAANVNVTPTNYENLINIDEYISLNQYPTSMRKSDTNSSSEVGQKYGVFLTAGHTSSSSKIVVAIYSTDATAEDANKVVKVAKEGTFEAYYDGAGSGVAYVEP